MKYIIINEETGTHTFNVFIHICITVPKIEMCGMCIY